MTKKLAYSALIITIIFIATAMIYIPVANLGFINLSDSLILSFASFLNPLFAFLVSGIGTMLADIYLGYTNYAIFTFIIKGLEGLSIYYLLKKYQSSKARYFCFAISLALMVCGYGLADVILTSSWAMFIPSISLNLLQALASYVIALILYPIVKKLFNKNVF